MKLWTLVITVSLALLHAYYSQADGGEGYGYGPSHGGYGYGPSHAEYAYEDDYDYGDEEDLKKKLGTAAAIAVPIAVGVGVGAGLLKKKLPLLGLLSPLNPLNPLNALNPLKPNPLAALGTLGALGALKPRPPLGLPFDPLKPLLALPALGLISVTNDPNGQGLTIGLPALFPGAGNLVIGNPRVPLLTVPTPFGAITIGFNKRSVDEQEKYGRCEMFTATTMWNMALLMDKDTLCIPKSFCTLMAKRTSDSKPKSLIEKEMLDYINSQVHGDEKALLKRANENVILYSAALGTYSKNVDRCAEVFNHCPEELNNISEEAEKLLS